MASSQFSGSSLVRVAPTFSPGQVSSKETTMTHLTIADLPDLVTVKECLAVCRIGRTKGYELINAGVLEVVKFGKRTTRVKRSSIEKLIASGIA